MRLGPSTPFATHAWPCKRVGDHATQVFLSALLQVSARVATDRTGAPQVNEYLRMSSVTQYHLPVIEV